MGRDRQGEPLEVEVDQRDTQDRVVGDADRVERDVETVSLVDYFAEVVVGGLLVEGVDLGRVGRSASGDDLLGDELDGRQGRPVRKTSAPSDANVRATAPPIAASRSVDLA